MSYSHVYCPKLLTVTLVVLGLTAFLPDKTPCAGFPRENAVVQAVKRVSPAVVNISSQYNVIERSNPFFDFGLDPFFESFFKDFFEPNYQRRYKRNSLGSGVIIVC
jgi:S1-C subfamily serine protease